MHHGYDVDGWYAGLVDDDAQDSTVIAPPLDSLTTTPGELRARWVCRSDWAIEPYPAPVVPAWVWMWQAREVLIEQGLIDQVPLAIAAIGDPIERAKAANRWEFDTKVNRDNALMEQLRQAINITDEQLSAMFIAAAAKQ